MSSIPFLKRLAAEVVHRHKDKLDEVCVILPSRRATVFFRQHLSQIIEKPVWMPALMSLQDFVEERYPHQILDPLELNFMLFSIYQKHQPEEPFDKFYPWGQMLLKDFDEVDRYMVNADRLFQNLKEVKEIEQWEPSAIKFWQEMETEDPKPVQQRFYRLWELAGILYNELAEQLRNARQGYEGMAYRWMAEAVSTEKFNTHYSQLYFAGFNALSTAEEVIIKGLAAQRKATVFFDADPYFLDDPQHEAGRFIRKYIKEWKLPEVQWLEPHLTTETKHVSMIGTSLKTEQATALASELEKQAEEGQPRWENTAVVLADQGLLFPVLHSLPAAIRDVNVTMGYPLRFSPLFSLFDSMGQLHSNAREKAGKHSFFYKDVMALLSHPYLRQVRHEQTEKLSREIRRGQTFYIDAVDLTCDDPVLSLIFSLPATPDEAASLFSALLDELRVSLTSDNKPQILEQEFIFQYKILLNRLHDVMTQHRVEMPQKTFSRLFREIVSSASLPFSGEPLKGLQVMGMLETRTLDFEDVYILSVNEGSLPSGSRNQSFIPYDLRKAHHLPSHEEQSALYAYHFYRLLQRGVNVRLFYTTEAGSLGTGEKSRFLLQVEQLLAPANPRLQLKKFLYSSPVSAKPPRSIAIERTDEITRKLQAIVSERGLSASALIMYALCPLKFYLHYVMKLKEEDELTQELEASEFGSIYHDAMEYLYKDQTGKKLVRGDFEQMKNAVTDAIKHGFRKADRDYGQAMENRNFFDAETLRFLVEMTLQADSRLPEFELLALEYEASVEHALPKGTNVKLYGKIDRIDRSSEGTRIVDYKTGNVSTFRFLPGEEPEISVTNKEAFQVYFYAYLYYRISGETRLIPAVLPLKQVAKGYSSFPKQEKVLSKEDLEQFEIYLSNLIQEVFTAPAFVQTTDTTVCQYCAFNTICLRN